MRRHPYPVLTLTAYFYRRRWLYARYLRHQRSRIDGWCVRDRHRVRWRRLQPLFGRGDGPSEVRTCMHMLLVPRICMHIIAY